MKFMTPSRRFVAAAVLATIAMPTLAATATSTFTVNGTVVATCSVSATALNFGASIPTPVNSNIDATSTITATCSNAVPFSVALNAGNGAGATVISRKMSSGPNSVNYAMYTDAGRTNIWGDGTPGSAVNSLTGTGAAQAIPVYGRIPTGQTPAIGIYSDTILVTLTF
ncbi:MAG: SCPU domain-containing protein [Burkholderiales bacterium]|nr:MAG: SCPU domain-containing protein [Burkholderiales bacterium]